MKKGTMLLSEAQKQFDYHAARARAWKAVIDIISEQNIQVKDGVVKPRSRGRRKVDPDALVNTLAFLKERKGKHTTLSQVANYFRISRMAAGYRLWALSNQVRSGITRISRGVYTFSG